MVIVDAEDPQQPRLYKVATSSSSVHRQKKATTVITNCRSGNTASIEWGRHDSGSLQWQKRSMQMKKYLYKPSIFSSYVFNIAKPSC
jgi:hypothetical protein